MNLKKAVILSGLAMVMMATTQIVFAEEAAVTPTDSVLITSNQQSAAQKDSEMQWAWGEVTNLDSQNKTVTLKYLDYETDQEKDLALVVDEKTTFENIQDFNELKLKDTLSVDYMTGPDNRNIAKNISFEKPEDVSGAPAVVEEAVQPVTSAPVPQQPVVDAASATVPAQTVAEPVPSAVQSETPVDPSMAVNEAAPSVAPAAPVAESVPATQDQAQ